MGLDELVPSLYRARFSKRDEDGNHVMPAIYKDYINAYGYGASYVDELR